MPSVDVAGPSACVHLQHLAVCTAQSSRQLKPADWASLAQLSCLTELCLLNAVFQKASPEACAALSKLTRLQVITAYKLPQTFVPALTACVQLTEIIGTWQPLCNNDRAVVCLPQVLVLNIPTAADDARSCFERFPNVRHLREDVLVDGVHHLYAYAMEPLHLSDLCKHCTHLQRLVLTAAGSSFASDADHLDCVAAIQSLTALQHLTRLDFTPYDNPEFLALIQSCCVLDDHSLQELHVSDGC